MTFKLGDLVEHRASGQRGIVVDIQTHCATHASQFIPSCSIHGKLESCVREPSGYLTIETDYSATVDVHERNVRKIDDTDNP